MIGAVNLCYNYLILSGSNGLRTQDATKWQRGDTVNHHDLPCVKVECNPTFAARQATMRLVVALSLCRILCTKAVFGVGHARQIERLNYIIFLELN